MGSQPDKMGKLKSRIHGLEQREVLYQSQVSELGQHAARETKAKGVAKAKVGILEKQLGEAHQQFQGAQISADELRHENSLLRRKMDRLEGDANALKRGYVLSNTGMKSELDKVASFHELQTQEYIRQINKMQGEMDAQEKELKSLRSRLQSRVSAGLVSADEPPMSTEPAVSNLMVPVAAQLAAQSAAGDVGGRAASN